MQDLVIVSLLSDKDPADMWPGRLGQAELRDT